MTETGFTRVATRRVHDGRVFTLNVETFESPDGERFDRDLIRHPGAVAILPITAEDHVVFVRQFRPAIDAALLEIPAGLLDVDGESLEIAAARELAEEVGLRAGRLTRLTTFVAAPGMADERVTLFLAEDLVAIGTDLQGPEERHMIVERIPFGTAVAQVLDGTIIDAKTVIALLLAAARRRA